MVAFQTTETRGLTQSELGHPARTGGRVDLSSCEPTSVGTSMHAFAIHTKGTDVRVVSARMLATLGLMVTVATMLCTVGASVGGSTPMGATHSGISTMTPLNVTFAFTAYGSCDGGPASVPFHSNVTGGLLPYNYDWNFGDGSPPSENQDPIHTYSNSFGGPYNVTLTVKDASGSTASRTQTLLFLFPPCPSRAQFPVLLTPLEFVVVGGAVAALATTVVLAHRGRGPRP